MANNPNNIRQRDGAAQLSQHRKEYRLFDESSSSVISAALEVWNEPVVVHVHNLAPGQGVAVDTVSDYDGVPTYTPFTPTRGTPLILDEDLTSVVLFYSGRYVLRLTGTGLGTIRAFAYPFSVSHDWGDYYGGLGTGGDVVRSLEVIDTASIDMTVVPDPGVGDVTIRSDVIVSPQLYNIFQVLGDGCYVRGPDNGTLGPVPTSVLDTATINQTLVANVLSADVIRSGDVYNIIELRANGVYVRGPDNGGLGPVPTSVLDTQSIDLTLAMNVLSADVIISPDAGNSLALRANGLYSTGFAGTITSAADTNTIDHTVSVGVLTSQVIRSPDGGNLLELRANGVYSGVGTAATSVLDTLSIDLTLASNILQADLRIDPSAENVLNLNANGVLVEAATTAEEEAETAGDLVITAAVLGHIVNARTGTQSSHLGVDAGNLAPQQVAVGYQTGMGVTGSQNVAVGAFAGTGVIGTGNIALGYNVANTVSGNYNINIGTGASPAPNDSYGIFIGNDLGTPVAGYNGHIIIGYQALKTATNTGLAVAIGYRALYGSNLSGSGAQFGGATSVGVYSGDSVFCSDVSVGGVSLTSFGFSSGSSANIIDAVLIGTYAGDKLGVSNSHSSYVVAVGSSAASSAFNLETDGGESTKNIVAIGYRAMTGARAYGTASKPPEYIQEIGDVYTAVGTYAANGTEGVNYTVVGDRAGMKAGLITSTAIGELAGYAASMLDSVAVGSRAGIENNLDRATIVGAQAHRATFSGVTPLVTFTETAINPSTFEFTVGAHGLTVGTYVTLGWFTDSGAEIAGLNPGNGYVFYVKSATVLRLASWTTTVPIAAIPGTRHLELPTNNYTNITVVGYAAVATASNQVTLGDANVTTLRTAGKIQPGDDSGGYQSATGMYGGTGAPNNANGIDGDFYLRSDGGALTTIYHKRAGTWVGVV